MLPFNLPILNRPILWYGFFFALGFFLGYKVLCSLLKKNPHTTSDAKVIAEKMTLYVIIGAVVGARLGDMLFYRTWSEWLRDPWEIVRVWEGGLASHGGALGILIAVCVLSFRLKKYFPKKTFLSLLDLIVIPTGLVAACIRIGNFFNQEILGKPTQLFWGVVFGHAADGSRPIPRHPVQIYEALFYFAVFCLTWSLWKRKTTLHRPGKMLGLFLSLVFSFRFLIEFLKEEQSPLLSGSCLTMGQWLSVPFILLGLILFQFPLKKSSSNH